jgi:hypothetical protein
MSDDLIKRLHNVRLEGVQELCWEAAYRIEESEAKLAEAVEVAKIWQEDFIEENNRWGDALRKLAKAVESIKQSIKLWEKPVADREYKLDNAYDGFELLCLALAELEK